MEYKKCCLFGLKSKTKLFELLKIDNKKYYKQSFVASKINPFLTNKNRLVEAPKKQLKTYQNRIFNMLKKIEIPDNIFCGQKGKSYIDNSKMHLENSNMFKVDISKFYPSISRDRIYRFFKNDLSTSPDVAEILTNFATIDLNLKNQKSKAMIDVNAYLVKKNISCRNHLITGSPFGALLSYFVNLDLYNELQDYADKNNLLMTAYIDDIAFSSNGKISGVMQKNILNIIRKHHYEINKTKCKYYGNGIPKRLTGGIITKNKSIDAQNKLIKRANQISLDLKRGKSFTEKEIQNAYGLIAAIEMTDRKMPQLKKRLKEERKQI